LKPIKGVDEICKPPHKHRIVEKKGEYYYFENVAYGQEKYYRENIAYNEGKK